MAEFLEWKYREGLDEAIQVARFGPAAVSGIDFDGPNDLAFIDDEKTRC